MSKSLNQSMNIGQGASNAANAQHNLLRFFTFTPNVDQIDEKI